MIRKLKNLHAHVSPHGVFRKFSEIAISREDVIVFKNINKIVFPDSITSVYTVFGTLVNTEFHKQIVRGYEQNKKKKNHFNTYGRRNVFFFLSITFR